MSGVRAAVKVSKPPKAVLFNDPDHTEWDEWDYKLLKAAQFIEDITDEFGIPIHHSESERMMIEVTRKENAVKRAISKAEERNKKQDEGKPWVYYTPTLRPGDGGPMPTIAEWVEEQASKRGE